MASSSGSKRHRAVRTRGGKSQLRDDVAPGSEMSGFEDLLNQTRFFSERDQMIQYATQIYGRKIQPPKVMNLPWFRKEGFQFQNHLVFQQLLTFVTLQHAYYDDLIKVFYSNLKMTTDGNLQSEVSDKKIIISPSDWMPLAHLQYEGLEVSYLNIPEYLNYNREFALNSMLRPEFQGQGLRNVASLTVDDRLLHYVYVHILRPRSTNFAQLLQEDIFMLWAIKNNILINCLITL